MMRTHRVPLLPLVAIMVAGLAAAGKLPPDFKRCARSEPGLGECLRAAVEDTLPKLKAGLPKLGLAKLDPLFIKELRISQGGGGPVNADLVFIDMATTGLLDDDRVHSIAVDLDNVTVDASFVFPRCIVTGNYTVKGRVLVLPITGAGGSKLVLKDCECTWHMKGRRITKKDGKEYLDLTSVTIHMVPGKMEMQLDNLFGGDQQLGKAMNRILNDNWQLVYKELGPSFEQAYAEVVKFHARSLLTHVPIEDLFPEKL